MVNENGIFHGGSEAEIVRIVVHGEHIPSKIIQTDGEIKKHSTKSGKEQLNHHRIGLTLLKECMKIEI